YSYGTLLLKIFLFNDTNVPRKVFDVIRLAANEEMSKRPTLTVVVKMLKDIIKKEDVNCRTQGKEVQPTARSEQNLKRIKAPKPARPLHQNVKQDVAPPCLKSPALPVPQPKQNLRLIKAPKPARPLHQTVKQDVTPPCLKSPALPVPQPKQNLRLIKAPKPARPLHHFQKH
ncbi:hypothetical protein OTU49_009667, partial [Cherax quadricarinatus]